MKNTKKVLVGALALLTVISMGAMSGTYAKYASELVDASDSARVAKWFTLANKDTDLELFDDTIKPGDSKEYTVGITGSAAETPEVAYKLSTEITGNNSIVNAAYSPIKFYVNDTECADIAAVQAEVNTALAAKTYAAGEAPTVSPIKIKVEWPAGDATIAEGESASADAKLAEALKDTTEAIKLNVKVIATQVVS